MERRVRASRPFWQPVIWPDAASPASVFVEMTPMSCEALPTTEVISDRSKRFPLLKSTTHAYGVIGITLPFDHHSEPRAIGDTYFISCYPFSLSRRVRIRHQVERGANPVELW